MARRWNDPAAFRADPNAVDAAPRPSYRQTVSLVLALALVAGAVAAVSFFVTPDRARSFHLFHGSLFLSDTSVGPLALDLATGRPTIRLLNAQKQVRSTSLADLGVVPLAGDTLLLNQQSGEFNMVDATGFVIKNEGGGVPLPTRGRNSRAVGIATGNLAFIEQTGSVGTSVYLVDANTVRTANADGTAKARASRSLDSTASVAPGAAAAAGTSLWLLLGTGSDRTVQRLDLPEGSGPGATLKSVSVGTVSGAAAMTTAGSGDNRAVGLGSSDRIEIFRGAGRELTRRFTAPPGVTEVLAVGNGDGRLAYLMHARDGWYLVSVAVDGSGLLGPNRVTDMSPTADLIAPATSNGRLYTMDVGTLALYQISWNGASERVPGAPVYPRASFEARQGFDDSQVIGRGSRVVFNSPGHSKAVVVFTDQSHPPLTVEKNDAVVIDPSGGAKALARNRAVPPKTDDSTPPPAPVPAPRQQPAPNIDVECSATTQQPHIPVLVASDPGSRSVLLRWTYPQIEQNDCLPSTYQVQVERLGGSGPQPPGPITVNAQTSVNLTGLYPSTRYEVFVTAYLRGRGTRSAPVQIQTGPEGPAAPQDVTARADGDGNWILGWKSCGTARSGCVPADSWRIVPRFCDGVGLGNPPDLPEIVADPTSSTQPGAIVPSGSSLLGRGLRFAVEGLGPNGTVGTPSALTDCAYSWAAPVPAAMRLSATRPGDTAFGETTTTTVSLDLGDDAVRAVGGVGATVTFSLAGPGGRQIRTVTADGRRSTLSATFLGVRPGAVYSASATVAPPGHPEAAVDLGPQTVTTRSTWPGVGADAQCANAGPVGLICSLSVQLTGVSSAGSAGERFDLTDASQLQCGQAVLPLDRTGFDPSVSPAVLIPTVSQLDKYYGACTVTVQLVESSTNPGPLFYGGTVSPVVRTPIDLGPAVGAGVTGGDLVVSWDPSGNAAVRYTGSSDLSLLTRDWSEQVTAPDGTACGRAVQLPGRLDTTAAIVPVPASCINSYGDQAGWSVALSYTDSVDGDQHTVGPVTIPGTPPTYVACVPGDFTAAWGATRDDGVTVGVTGGQLQGCTDWQLTVHTPNPPPDASGTCGSATAAPPAVLTLTCADAATDGWTVSVQWTRPDGTPGRAVPDVPVSGTPPP